MNGEYSMDHYNYNEETRDYEYDQHGTKDGSPILMLLIIIVCSLSLNLFRCFITEDREEESPINSSLLLEKKGINDENILKETCVICLDPFLKEDKIASLECNHMFHYKCITLWVENKNTCPLCRITLL